MVMKFLILLALLLSGGLFHTSTDSGSSKQINKLLSENPTVSTYLDIDKVTGMGTTYYVSPEKTKANHGSGLSKEDPESIYLLEDKTKVQPGDTIILTGERYVMKGDYVRIMTSISGEYNKYITIKSETNKNVTLDFYDALFYSTNRGVSLNGNYVYWCGVDICGAGDNGLYIGGSYNIIERSQFYNNRDSGLQLGRADGSYSNINQWPSFNYIRDCTSFNNYDNETYGENADGFAAKLTIGYGNVFDGCIAYRNSDDGWDLYAKTDSGSIGAVIIYNCVAFENGFLAENQGVCNARFRSFDKTLFGEKDASGNYKDYSFNTRDGDGNGFKLGGSIMEGDTYLYNSMSFNNKMHGITDNSNPGTIYTDQCTSADNGAIVCDTASSVNYGQVVKGTSEQESGDECANIDVSRQTYSYNIVKKSLSLKSSWSTSIGKDAVRGCLSDSIIGTKFGDKNAYKIVGSIDADTKLGITGDAINALDPSAVVEKMPIEFDGTTYTYHLSGLDNYDVHEDYRNSDYSVNMHDILKIKNYNALLGNDNKIGADLSKTSWDQYNHYEWTDYSSFASQDDAIIALYKNAIFLPINMEAVYQDFKVFGSLNEATLTWTSSDTSVIEIGELTPFSASSSRQRKIVVNRGLDGVKEADLSVEIKYGSRTSTKSFHLIVQPGTPSIGEISAVGIFNGRYIYDSYAENTLPELVVTNGNDYSGKALPKEAYTITRRFFYAADKKASFYEVKGFTTSKAGVYRVENLITLKSTGDTKLYTFEIYVTSASANVAFDNNSNLITINKNGFNLSGNLTSATGRLYVYTSDTEKSDITGTYIVENGDMNEFRDDSISYNYNHTNNDKYYIYYVLTNLKGEITSEVYKSPVNVVEITSVEDFNRVFSSETSSSSIYLLRNDLDFNGKACQSGTSKKVFRGLFNGLGHTISNVKVKSLSDASACIWSSIEGGTIENVKFNELDFDCGGSNKQVGVIGKMTGGNVYNVHITNVKSYGKERVGGLIGQVFEGTETNISHVSIINDASHTITADSKDAAGIIGLCQTTSNPLADFKVKMDNILVSADVFASTYAGGVIGRFDDQKPTISYSLDVRQVVVHGSVKTSGNYCGGVLGGQVGSSRIYFYNCICMADLYHKGSGQPLVVAEKNCSPILGRHSSFANVNYCAGLFQDYEDAFDVTVYSKEDIKDIRLVTAVNLGDDWNNNPQVAPYYTLKFMEF